MKRTKKLPSRKAKTLRRGIVLAVCLVGILALYQPLPHPWSRPSRPPRPSWDGRRPRCWEKPRSSPLPGYPLCQPGWADDNGLSALPAPLPCWAGRGEALPICASNTPSQAYPSSLTAIPFQPEEGKEGSLLLFGQVDPSRGCRRSRLR